LFELFNGEQVAGECLAVGKLGGAIAACGIEKVKQAGATLLVGIFADIS